jgi:hypothetical protein
VHRTESEQQESIENFAEEKKVELTTARPIKFICLIKAQFYFDHAEIFSNNSETFER